MGLWHSEETSGRSFNYQLNDVKTKYLDILINQMGCLMDKEITNTEIKLKVNMNFKYNMNEGDAIISFLPTQNGVDVKIRVIINQAFWSKIPAWIDKGFELLENELKNCKPYIANNDNYIVVDERKIKCPLCDFEFAIHEDLDAFFCPKCGAKIIKKS